MGFLRGTAKQVVFIDVCDECDGDFVVCSPTSELPYYHTCPACAAIKQRTDRHVAQQRYYEKNRELCKKRQNQYYASVRSADTKCAAAGLKKRPGS